MVPAHRVPPEYRYRFPDLPRPARMSQTAQGQSDQIAKRATVCVSARVRVRERDSSIHVRLIRRKSY